MCDYKKDQLNEYKKAVLTSPMANPLLPTATVPKYPSLKLPNIESFDNVKIQIITTIVILKVYRRIRVISMVMRLFVLSVAITSIIMF